MKKVGSNRRAEREGFTTQSQVRGYNDGKKTRKRCFLKSQHYDEAERKVERRHRCGREEEEEGKRESEQTDCTGVEFFLGWCEEERVESLKKKTGKESAEDGEVRVEGRTGTGRIAWWHALVPYPALTRWTTNT